MEEQEKESICLAICDDEVLSLNRLREMADRILASRWKRDIFCTHSPDDLRDRMHDKKEHCVHKPGKQASG